MAGGKATIKDIARRAMVSPTAVSMVLNGKKGLSSATTAKILATIKEMDYHPNAASQRLVHRRSFNIAFIYPGHMSPFSDLFYSGVAEGLTEELTGSHFNVVFVPLPAKEGKIPDIINKQDADGAILLHDTPPFLLQRLVELGLPYLLLDWQSEANGHLNISLDCERSVHRAVMYLLHKGHKRIAFIGSESLPHYYLRCFTGYKDALDSAQLPIYTGWIHSGVSDVTTAAAALRKLQEMPEPASAICCMSDMCAIYALKAAAMLGIAVPRELSLIGIDDISVGPYTSPALTTISYNKKEIGKEAGRLLVRALGGESAESIVIGSDVIMERETVARPD